MASWKQAPGADDDGSGLLGAVTDFGSVEGLDAWEYVTIAGVEVPTAAIALPIAVFALYQVFAALRRAHDRRPGTTPTEMDFDQDN